MNNLNGNLHAPLSQGSQLHSQGIPQAGLSAHDLNSVMQGQDMLSQALNDSTHPSVNGYRTAFPSTVAGDNGANLVGAIGGANMKGLTGNPMSNMNNIGNGNEALSLSQLQQRQQRQQPQQQQQLNRAHYSQSQGVNFNQQPVQQAPMSYAGGANGTHNVEVNDPASSLDHPETKYGNGVGNTIFQNPFYGNSYPITNPPLFDTTMLLPLNDGTGHTRRRRISISNGQIGQIVNHEAFFMDEDLMEEYYEQSRQIRPHSPMTPTSGVQDDSARSRRSVMPVGASTMAYNSNNPDEQAQLVPSAMNAVKNEYPQPVASNSVTLNGHVDLDTRSTSAADNRGVAGLPPPNHLLIYNNEVIFNPNNGPIPGTAAWKKERLLERNRVAASKCRQRKKHAQQQLQDNMNKAERQMKEKEALLKKYENLIEIYNSALKRHFNGEEGVLEPLRQHLNNPITE